MPRLGNFARYFFVATLATGLIEAINKKKVLPLIHSAILILLISMTTLTCLSPFLKYRFQYGRRFKCEVAHRMPAETEVLGLKIIQLLLPPQGCHAFRQYRDYYNFTAPLINENKSAALGLFGSIGFLFLLLVLMVRRWQVIDKNLYMISKLNLCAILLATIGGFGSFFAYSISPMIRAYNRISVFIGFFALYALFAFIQYLLGAVDNSKKLSS
jgi:phosphoglycerol transferase